MSERDRKEEQIRLIHNYVQESTELLEEAGPLLIELEQTADTSGEPDQALLGKIFRLFHTMKGGAGYLDLRHIVRLTHAGETLLDKLRDGQLTIDPDMIDILNLALDLLAQALTTIDQSLNDQPLAEHLDSLTRTILLSAGESADFSKADAILEEEEPEFTVDEEQSEEFAQQACDILNEVQAEIEHVRLHPDSFIEDLNIALRRIHTLAVTSTMFQFHDIGLVSGVMRDILTDAIAKHTLPTPELSGLLLGNIGFLRKALQALRSGQEPKVQGIRGLVTLLVNAATKEGFEIEMPDFTPPQAVPQPQCDDKPDEPFAAEEIPSDRASLKDQLEEQRQNLEAIKREIGTKDDPQDTTVRISVSKLEEMMDLVEEMVITEAMLNENPYVRGDETSIHHFRKTLRHLEKLTHSLQDTATSLRMVPLKDTFREMLRLVRDTSRKTGKKTELKLVGERTEIDKGLIGVIRDPLIHLLRNAIDHGLEPAEERAAKGKSEIGHITLEAQHVSSDVVIRVSDDGHGLNRAKILAKARENGLITGTGAELSDIDVWKLIMTPGFSTADNISEYSGRGVGLDVVKKKIEDVRGRIEIYSKPDRGTSFIIRVPLTLALLKGIVVMVGEQRFIIPFVGIRQTLKVREQQITTSVDGLKLLRVREQFVPLMRLNDILHLESTRVPLEAGYVVIIEDRQKRLGLFVDRITGKLQLVVKGLSRYLGDSVYLAGTTIMGDGDVCPILNVPGIINKYMPEQGSLHEDPADTVPAER